MDVRRKRAFRTAFDFLDANLARQRMYAGQDADAFWSQACGEMTRLAQDAGNDPFLMGLLCACHEELERAAGC